MTHSRFWTVFSSSTEVPGMDEVKKAENHITSASAFVEGGVQDTCDDACSICLEDFSNRDPSTVTTCKHEFHVQCILEWCQRSSNCPMCWQPIGLKDPSSQELLVAVERERSLRSITSRNATMFHHPFLGDLELQHFPVGVNDPELEVRIIQHLAAAAAMRRSHHIAWGEGSRSHSSSQARPQFVVFSENSNSSSTVPVSASVAPGGAETESATTTVTTLSPPLMSSSIQTNQISVSSSGSPVMPTSQGITNDDSYSSESSSPNSDRAGPSDFKSFSDIWRSRLSSMSMKYKESVSRSTRGWKEKIFSRSSSMADIGSEVRREINAGIATVSRMMERLETRDNNTADRGPVANSVVDSSVMGLSNHDNRDRRYATPSNGSNTTSSAS